MNIYISLLITMAFSAFFSGMEIAFVSVDKLRFEMERKGRVTSRILSVFFKHPNEFISTMLVGNNIALVIYGILMAQIIGDNLLAGFIDSHFLMVLAQTVISTLIILVTGEFLPKTLFKINPNLVLNVAAIPLFICYIVLYPISKFASGVSCLFLRIFGMKVNKEASDIAFGKVDLDYFIQSSIDNAENEEELDTEIAVEDLIGTIEYDYPAFHLSMDCFWCEVVSGELVLKEAEAARWLTKEEFDSVPWLPADQTILDVIRSSMQPVKPRHTSEYDKELLQRC